MPRLCALLFLAGVAVAALPRRRPVHDVSPLPEVRLLTPAELLLLISPSPSQALH